MAVIKWDRLMETCLKYGEGDILLAAGAPPQLRVPGGLSELPVPKLDSADLQVMVEELRSPPAVANAADRYDYHEGPGYKYQDISYRDGHLFRAAVFGDPAPTFIVLMHFKQPTTNAGQPAPIASTG
jgi:Tfp pilus assembly pilus retraction ATPase PilT